MVSEEIRNLILKDSSLQAKLMLALKKSYSTIRRWVVKDDLMLTTTIAQKVIKEHMKDLKVKEPTEK